MKEAMKKSVNLLSAVIIALTVVSACEKQDKPSSSNPPQTGGTVSAPLCTYIYDGKEYPVYSISSVDDGAHIMVRISPFKEGETQTTYAVIGISSDFEGVALDVGSPNVWSNDNYYFIYESPLMYYSQYRSLRSGTIMIRRLSGTGSYKVLADVILPDGRDFKFEHEFAR